MKRLLLVAVVVAACRGPDSYVMQNGKQLFKPRWEEDVTDLKARAAYELGCAENLELTVLTTLGDAASTVGAAGCGKQSVYVRIGWQWVRDSEVRPAAPREEPKPKSDSASSM
jgi:hypothetical protein